MAIWEIDGINKDVNGRKNEDEFNINLYMGNGILIDVEITPLYCLRCNKQLDGFYKHAGSRYGHVGEAGCNHCGSRIICTDNDNMVTELTIRSEEGRMLVLDYYELYRLERGVWKAIKESIGYDIFQKHKSREWTTLQTVINEICSEYHIDIEDLQTGDFKAIYNITKLPEVVNRWIALLRYIGIDIK